MDSMEKQAKIKVILLEEDIPGARLPRENVEECTVTQLRRWLLCRGAKTSGKKSELVKRFVHIPYLVTHEKCLFTCSIQTKINNR